MSKPLPNALQQFVDSSGNKLAGGKLYSYAAGTSTPLVTYTDQTAGTPNANPTILDANGRASIWIPQTTGYKFQLQDSLGNIIWTIDNAYLIENGSIGASQIQNQAVGTAQLASNPISTAKIALGAITTALLATGCVTTVKIATGAVTIDKIQSNIDLTALTNMVAIVPQRRDDFSGGKITLSPQYPWSAPTVLAAPGTLPAGQPVQARWSPDNRFLAVCHAITPFITIYERSGTTLKKLANPATLPAGTPTGISWTGNGAFLAVAHATTPFITIYQRQGNVFTKLTNPSALPASAATSVAFSPNGEFLIATTASNFKLYQISGTTLTDISSGSGITASANNSQACWSSDSQYLAFSRTDFPIAFQLYYRAGVSFYPFTIFTSGNGRALTACAFSPDNQFLVAASPTNVSRGIELIQLSGTPVLSGGVVSGISKTTIGLGTINEANDVSWSPDGKYLAAALIGSPFMMVWSVSGTTFTPLSAPASPPASAGNGISWSMSGQFLSVAGGATPYVNTYQTASTLPSVATLFGRNFLDV